MENSDKEEDTHHPVGFRSLPWNLYEEFIDMIPKEKRPSVLIEV